MSMFHDNGTRELSVALRKSLTPISCMITLDSYCFSSTVAQLPIH